MTIILFDDSARASLLPLTYTRPVAALRVGILTIAEKWAKHLKGDISYLTADYLQEKFRFQVSNQNIFINGSVCPDEPLLEAVDALSPGEALWQGDILLAARLDEADAKDYRPGAGTLDALNYNRPVSRLFHPEDIFLKNEQEIVNDFRLLTAGRSSAPLSNTNVVLGDNIFVEEGVFAECSIFNTLQGPVYLGRNSEVWENSSIRGAFALCEGAQVKMGSRIYPKTTVGPCCRVGGEINNAVFQSYSSKGHDGYLGNSVIGEWCNLGADSNNSNLKNNYGPVKLFDYPQSNYRDTGLQFCGLVMGDHSKCSINTMFNTGTVVGVSANIYGAGFPSTFVPDFSWGGGKDMQEYRLEKAAETIERVFLRRNKVFDTIEKQILSKVFDLTKQYRNFNH